MATKRMLALTLALALLISGCAAGRKSGSSAPAPQVAPVEQPGSPPSNNSTSTADSARPTTQVETKTASMGQATAEPTGSPVPPGWIEPNTPPRDMYFQDAGENPLINTAKRPTSTFSVDVDTASFTLARNYLNRSMLPPPESVRVEEFINYFPQGYPKSDEQVAVYVEGSPHPFHNGTYLLEIGLKAREVKAAQRKPAVLTFVVDVSGSMDMENRLGLVKRSLQMLLDQLESDDRVGLVIYASEGKVLLEHTSDKEKIRQAIDQLRPGGSTYAEEGIRLGYELAYRNFLESGINRVLLLSDGVANVGETGPQEILRQVEDYKQKGIYLTTVGVGMGNYNDTLMEQLADKGDGQYAYVDEIGEAHRFFVEQMGSTLQLMAKDTKVQVHFDPEQVATYRLVGYENRVMANQDFRNDRADAGEMGAGQTVTALYEITLTGNANLLGSVSIRYKDPDSGEVTEKAHDITRSHIFSTPSAHLLWTAAVAEFAGILARSPWAAETSLEAVRTSARRAASDLGMQESHLPLLDMIEQARSLR